LVSAIKFWKFLGHCYLKPLLSVFCFFSHVCFGIFPICWEFCILFFLCVCVLFSLRSFYSPISSSLVIFFWWYWGLTSGPSPLATPPALFCKGFFDLESHGTICPGDIKPWSSSSLPLK
jgi:hypothetical protein